MSGSDKVITAYPNYAPQKFDQSLPGKDQSMEPLAEHTKVERWHRGEPRLEEYVGNGKLKGKVALITGADSGIGRTVAAFFAREGAAGITVNYLPEEEEDAQVTKKLIEDAGRKALLVPGDLRSQTFREKLVNEHIKAFGHLDILVNNASQQLQCKDLAEIDMDKVNDTFQTNIIQYIGVAKAALPHMQRGDVIINTTNKGSAGMVDYSATKGAIATFTRSLAQQLMPKAIRVCAVAPGPVYTPLQPASRSPDQMEDWGVESVPLHGRVAQPAELGESYVYLATSNLSTGTIVHPNSGQFFVPTSSPLPTPYYLFFSLLEPFLTYCGAAYAIFTPLPYFVSLFPASIIPAPLIKAVHPASIMATRQLGSCFFLFALMGSIMLPRVRKALEARPNEMELVVEAYLGCLAAADLTHIGFTLYDLGFDATLQPFVHWNTLVVGNVLITTVLFAVRMMWFAGIGRARFKGAVATKEKGQ
ncbi:hypothetical protein JCM1841_000210 [Sporobolomyces salmonicolor]